MDNLSPTLVIVAYQMDDMLFFSSVCKGADVMIVRKHCRCGAPANFDKVREAQAAFGISRAECLELGFGDTFPNDALSSWLRSVGKYSTVYTNCPFDDSYRTTVALVTSRALGRVSIPATASAASETYCVSRETLLRKAALLNDHCPAHVNRVEARNCPLLSSPLAGSEAFTHVGHEEIVRGIAVTKGRVFGYPDLWAFKTSAFERSRYAVTCEVLLYGLASIKVRDIIEVGACEGEMTARLCESFPDSRIHAVEPHPVFSSRLQDRFRDDKRVEVLRRSIADIELEADVVVLAETLSYFSEETIRDTFTRLRARHLLLSIEALDPKWRDLLGSLGWQEIIARDVWPRLEPVDGGAGSDLITLRTGTTVYLWEQVQCRSQ